MAFTKSTKNDRLVASETVTLTNASTVSGATIDFVKPGHDFTVFVNTAALNTVGAVTTDLQGSFDNSTWADLDASFVADCDTATLAKAYDASASGDYPYYRLQFDSAADDSANELTYKVVTS